MTTFDAVVLPMIGDPALAAVLRTWSVKGSHLIAGYCRMAALPFPAATAVLGCCFARVYDDVLDDRGADPAVADRFAVLVAGGGFTPASDLERLLGSLYNKLSARIGGDERHPVRCALVELHRYQLLSRPGAPVTGAAALREITIRKGGLSLLILFGLAARAMLPPDRDLVHELGGCLQMLDDYQDLDTDRRLGIPTLATAGRLSLVEIVRRLRAVESAMRARYGCVRARSFFDDLYLFLMVAAVGRIWRGLRPARRLKGGRPRSPLGVLLLHGGNVLDG